MLEGPLSRQCRNIYPITGAKISAEQPMHICYGRERQSQVACEINLLLMVLLCQFNRSHLKPCDTQSSRLAQDSSTYLPWIVTKIVLDIKSPSLPTVLPPSAHSTPVPPPSAHTHHLSKPVLAPPHPPFPSTSPVTIPVSSTVRPRCQELED